LTPRRLWNNGVAGSYLFGYNNVNPNVNSFSGNGMAQGFFGPYSNAVLNASYVRVVSACLKFTPTIDPVNAKGTIGFAYLPSSYGGVTGTLSKAFID